MPGGKPPGPPMTIGLCGFTPAARAWLRFWNLTVSCNAWISGTWLALVQRRLDIGEVAFRGTEALGTQLERCAKQVREVTATGTDVVLGIEVVEDVGVRSRGSDHHTGSQSSRQNRAGNTVPATAGV